MSCESPKKVVQEFKLFSLATDPVYIGTGGFTIGRVDNTIVRDPITKLPKIPGSSLAGTWRYYVTLELLTAIKKLRKEHLNEIIDFLKSEGAISDEEKNSLENNKENISTGSFNHIKNSIYEILKLDSDNAEKRKNIHESLKRYFDERLAIESLPDNSHSWKYSKYNNFSQITCAGQDNVPQEDIKNSPFATNKDGNTGHCGHCIVCKGFGFSKKDLSWQGMVYFSDLQILFFPVFTRLGTKWVTTKEILKDAGLDNGENPGVAQQFFVATEKIEDGEQKDYINLGWIYLPYKKEEIFIDLSKLKFDKFELKSEDIIIVSEDLFSQIVNSNLEVRTSVSINPITGAAKEGALFTSEAIPRGTIFYGSIRIFNKAFSEEIKSKFGKLPTLEDLKCALDDSKHYFETLGIGGMTTRGFGRLKINFDEVKTNEQNEAQN